MTGYRRSPINYMGGKYRSLKYIVPNFKPNIDTFYDLFSGSGTVHLNTKANKVIANDINHIVINLQKYISENNPYYIYEQLINIANEYRLDSEESIGYNSLRKEYNKDRDPLKLLALSQHAFNYILRFNKKGEFNASHGKGICKLSQDFLEKLINFNEKTQRDKTEFKSLDFREVINLNILTKNDLVYCDPPYLLSEAVYNEKRAFGGWSKQDTIDLLSLLDKVNERGSNFALTEMVLSKGEINSLLVDWVKQNNYSIIYYDVQYLGVPSTHNNDRKSVEVLVTNYKIN